MDRRRRIAIIFFAVLPLIAAGLLVQLCTVLNINPRDPVFGVKDGEHALYNIHGRGDAQNFEVKVVDSTPASSAVTVETDDGLLTYRLDTTGAILDVSGPVYPIFWVPIDNPMLRTSPEFTQWHVRDVAGWFGPSGEDYTVKIQRTFILWDDVLQSQASYLTELRTRSGKRVGEVVYDATCGLAFVLKSYSTGKEARLIDTSFPISRNRNWLHFWNLVMLALLIYGGVKWSRKGGEELQYLRKLTLSYILVGSFMIFLDTNVDIWEPFLLSKKYMIVLHAGLALVATLLWGRHSAAAWIELAVIIGFGYYERQGISPMAAFFPGLTLSWLSALMCDKRLRKARDNA